jgi:putative ATPase
MQQAIPLAERMRPISLDTYIGQSQILGIDSTFRIGLDKGLIPSMILWGPPGVGKTTLAYLIAKQTNRTIHTLSAISSGVKDVRDVIQKVEQGGLFQEKGSILFIDEIHRFSKSQQDSLLNAVERGIITLIGATTENPSFEVISALLSRCQVYTLQSHNQSELLAILHQAIKTDIYLKTKNISLQETNALLGISGGDARKLLNVFELIISNCEEGKEIIVTNALVEKFANKSLAIYDKDGEVHYDIASAFIKSIRGSDPNAAVYWLARMIAGGEDPKFIARRLLIAASEDIGLANPTALVMANNTFQAVQVIGWPESRIILSQCVIYLATSPKGNAAYQAINNAQQVVSQSGNLPVPLHLRNAPTKLMKDLGYGEGYTYAHAYENNFIQQDYMPEALSKTNFFHAGSSRKEQEISEQIKQLWGTKYPI